MSNSTTIFENSWSVYQLLIEENYMHHAELRSLLDSSFKNFATKLEALRILDLGCGDGEPICSLLKPYNISSYIGLDLAQPALNIAAERFAFIGNGLHLYNANMESFEQYLDEPVNIIYSSFAIHHLQDEAKYALWTKIYNNLENEGRFIMIDVARENKASRSQYLSDYIDNCINTWNKLSKEGLDLINDHISNFDFPATQTFIKESLEEIGFTLIKHEHPDQFHHFWEWTK